MDSSWAISKGNSSDGSKSGKACLLDLVSSFQTALGSFGPPPLYAVAFQEASHRHQDSPASIPTLGGHASGGTSAAVCPTAGYPVGTLIISKFASLSILQLHEQVIFNNKVLSMTVSYRLRISDSRVADVLCSLRPHVAHGPSRVESFTYCI